jgi:hypothetical protein
MARRRSLQRMVRAHCHKQLCHSVPLAVLAVIQSRRNEVSSLSPQHHEHLPMRLVTFESDNYRVSYRNLRQHLQSRPRLVRKTRDVRSVFSCLCNQFVICHSGPLCFAGELSPLNRQRDRPHLWSAWFGSVISSVIMACINPHRLGFARSLESTLAIEIQSAAISNKHVLMKSLVARHKPAHQHCANATPLIFWQH